ncbi:hypothetical protein ACJMK2_017180 [Sinanodonta woodiana]|uniref:Uncharacterized protein n=1 Tax=Sinanodonta woodiana TaxID=1069815 RepID=A0ABD3UX44_SINWO
MAQISSHKTIIVLDHSSYFSHSSKQLIEYDILSKIKTPGIIPAAPITKSLWTVCVETVIEYLRVVYDIFPTKKLVRVVTGSEVMNSWAQKDQNVTIVMNNLAAVGPPKEEEVEDYDVVSGLTKAIEVMCQPSDLQNTLRTSLADNEAYVENRGRIICLTNLKSDAQVRMLEGCVSDALNEHNSLAEETDK